MTLQNPNGPPNLPPPYGGNVPPPPNILPPYPGNPNVAPQHGLFDGALTAIRGIRLAHAQEKLSRAEARGRMISTPAPSPIAREVFAQITAEHRHGHPDLNAPVLRANGTPKPAVDDYNALKNWESVHRTTRGPMTPEVLPGPDVYLENKNLWERLESRRNNNRVDNVSKWEMQIHELQDLHEHSLGTRAQQEAYIARHPNLSRGQKNSIRKDGRFVRHRTRSINRTIARKNGQLVGSGIPEWLNQKNTERLAAKVQKLTYKQQYPKKP